MINRGIVLMVLAIFFQVSNARATVYLHRTYDQALERSELIVKVTVIKNLPTNSHTRSCLVQVDEVLSGTLYTNVIQVNRDYIRLGPPREPYQTSETLVLCLEPVPKITRTWPIHTPTTPQYMIVGADAEGEFPLVGRDVWTRRLHSPGKPVKYAGTRFLAKFIPFAEFRSEVLQRNRIPEKKRPD